MTDLQTNGMGLDPEYAKAHEYATVLRLRQEQEFRDAKLEIESLRVNLAEAEARLRAMNDHNDWLADRLTLATIDRTLAMDQRAEYAVRLDMLRKILDDTGTGGKPEGQHTMGN